MILLDYLIKDRVKVYSTNLKIIYWKKQSIRWMLATSRFDDHFLSLRWFIEIEICLLSIFNKILIFLYDTLAKLSLINKSWDKFFINIFFFYCKIRIILKNYKFVLKKTEDRSLKLKDQRKLKS